MILSREFAKKRGISITFFLLLRISFSIVHIPLFMTTQWHLMMIITLLKQRPLMTSFSYLSMTKTRQVRSGFRFGLWPPKSKFTWVATVSVLLRSPPLLERLSSDDSIALLVEALLPPRWSRLARLLWHLIAKRVVTTRDIMSRSTTATTMAIRYSVRKRSSTTSWKIQNWP